MSQIPQISPKLASLLLDEVHLPSARGGRKAKVDLGFEIVRVLTREDLPELMNPKSVESPGIGLLHIKHTHHNLARLLASGRSNEEVSLLTGYSPSYVSSLQGNPAFADLLAYYGTIKEQVFVDVLERMKVLGLSTLDEIQHRLEEKPEDFSKRELMELTELLLVKGKQAFSPGPGQGQGGGVSIAISFVEPGGTSMKPAGGVVIDQAKSGA